MSSPFQIPAPLRRGETDWAVAVLRSYYSRLFGATARGYTGALFDSFDPSATRAASADVFTAYDLTAVSLLSVHVPGEAAIDILDRQRSRLSALLAETGPDRDLVEVESTTEDFPAHDLWRALRDLPGLGPTITSKLMARKRPRLLPIFDQVVNRHVYGGSGRQWEPLRLALQADDRSLHSYLLELRHRAGLGENVSALRVFDVLAWMDGMSYASKIRGASDTPATVIDVPETVGD